jgi:hypothetical protein
MYSIFERIKKKFKIKSNLQLLIILSVFSITGGLSLKFTTPILDFIGLSSFNSSDVLWENLLYFILRLIVLFPVYQLLRIVVGSLFFQHQFFKEFVKNTLCKMKIISETGK